MQEGQRASPPSTLIVGAGISGLALAQRLARMQPDADIKVIEASPRPGGWIRTQRTAGYLQECGPETIVDDGSGLSGLIADLDLETDLIRPSEAAALRHIVHRGELAALPTKPGAFLRTRLLPLHAKIRALTEPMRRKGTDPEESFASFVTRRFSKHVLERFAEPFASGIHAGVPEQMEVASCFPRLWAAEQQHGSVLRGMRKLGVGKPKILGFRGGNEDLITALRRALGDRLWLGRAVTAIRNTGPKWSVELGGERPTELQADRIVLTCASHQAADLVSDVSTSLAAKLRAIRFVSLASVHMGFAASAVGERTPGFGFLIPRSEARSRVLGVLFSSNLFPQRRQGDKALFRAILGGARHPDVLGSSDDEIAREAEQTFRTLTGVEAKQTFCRVWRHEKALACYEIGHGGRMEAIANELATLPGLHLSGLSYRGSGVSACIREARSLAERLAAE